MFGQVLWRSAFPGADMHFIENGAMFTDMGSTDADIMVSPGAPSGLPAAWL